MTDTDRVAEARAALDQATHQYAMTCLGKGDVSEGSRIWLNWKAKADGYARATGQQWALAVLTTIRNCEMGWAELRAAIADGSWEPGKE